jgi:S-adenosylmethionine:tRNA ribosyltransferase-isomerase
MRLSDFDYDLPQELIAQTPLPDRSASRLLVVDRAAAAVRHARFADLPELLAPRDLLVMNDTRVVPSRLFGVREGRGGRVELLLLRPVEDAAAGRFLALARPARRLEPGTRLALGASRTPAVVVEAPDAARRVVTFPGTPDVLAFLREEGHMPLPPYIRREDTPADRERYQTVFAARDGAVAAPTAGLHFTPALFGALADRGVARTAITLHVGLGTFAPVTAEDPRDHRMHAEHYRVGPGAAEAVRTARAAGGRVVAVGTTVVRCLETAAGGGGEPRRGNADRAAAPGAAADPVAPAEGWTRAFLYPPYRFRAVDALVTNFHLPRSSLLLLVSAFAGTDLVRKAYREAVDARYRFFSYGDAMLIV